MINGGQAKNFYTKNSQSQNLSKIKILNDDFAGQGLNSFKLAATGFSAVGAANTGFTFCLAELEPNDNPMAEPGIDRINYFSMGWQNPASYGAPSTFQSFMDNTVKP